MGRKYQSHNPTHSVQDNPFLCSSAFNHQFNNAYSSKSNQTVQQSNLNFYNNYGNPNRGAGPGFLGGKMNSTFPGGPCSLKQNGPPGAKKGDGSTCSTASSTKRGAWNLKFFPNNSPVSSSSLISRGAGTTNKLPYSSPRIRVIVNEDGTRVNETTWNAEATNGNA